MFCAPPWICDCCFRFLFFPGFFSYIKMDKCHRSPIVTCTSNHVRLLTFLWQNDSKWFNFSHPMNSGEFLRAGCESTLYIYICREKISKRESRAPLRNCNGYTPWNTARIRSTFFVRFVFFFVPRVREEKKATRTLQEEEEAGSCCVCIVLGSVVGPTSCFFFYSSLLAQQTENQNSPQLRWAAKGG
jgi:hypothetical protein